MKRNPVYESVMPPESALKSHHRNNDVYESSAAYKSGNSRKSSLEWSPNEMILMSEDYARKSAWDEEGDKDSVTAEIAPGIVVKGYVADL